MCNLTLEQQKVVAKLSITHRLVLQCREPGRLLEQLQPGLATSACRADYSTSVRGHWH